MSLKKLSSKEMVQHGGNLLDPNEEPRKIIDRLETGPGMVAMIHRANERLIEAQPPSGSEIEALTNAIAALDARHDELVRALDARFESEYYATKDQELRGKIARTRKATFPTGRAIIQATHVEEAGETKLRAGRLTESDRELFRSFDTIEKVSGEALLDELQAVGTELGKLHKRRDQLGKEGELVLKAGEARYHWIRVIRALEAVLIGEGIDPVTVLGAIYAAAAKAERRGANGTDTDTETDTDPEAPVADLDPPVPTDDDDPAIP